MRAMSMYRAVLSLSVAFLGLVLVLATWASAAERPSYQTLRFNEDWSVLSGGVSGDDPYDYMKYVELGDGVWLSTGGQLRLRYEGWQDFGFGGSANSDDFLLSRLFIHGDLHMGDNFRIFVQGKSSLAGDRDLPQGRRTLDVDEADVQNAFVDFSTTAGSHSLVLRAGRHELLFGKQRLVSPLDWSNTRRTFDGISVIVERSPWKATAFYSRLVIVDKYDLNDSDDDVELFGIYATTKSPGPEGLKGMDLYWLGLNRSSAAFNGSSGKEDRHTLGVRLWGAVAGSRLDFDVEGAWQLGEVGDDDISAFMVAAQVGTKFSQAAMKPRLELGLDYASGDDEAGDGDVETFNHLYPLGHAYLGYIDTVGRQNIIDVRATAAANPLGSLKAKLDLHGFWRADRDDALYNAGGGVARAGSAGTSREVGVELDLTVKQPLSRHTVVVAGYSHFFAGDFIDESGSGDDIDFVYTTLQHTF